MRPQNWIFLLEQFGGVSTQYFDGSCAQSNRGERKGRNLSVVLGGRGEEVDSFDGINLGQREKLKALLRVPRAKARKTVHTR